MAPDEKQEMRTRPCPDCCLCGARGRPLYQGLEDRLFHAPGSWNLVKCPDPGCGLVWMDPMPLEEDIGKAYEVYYTHESEQGSNRFLLALYRVVRVVFGFERQWRRVHLMYLDREPPGRLLEIGCGDGRRLALFRSRGWTVEGQEVDQKAAARARERYGIRVHLGRVGHMDLGEAGYDAVIMNHVVEHLHDPVGLLKECRRLLKPGGLLMATTPNVESRGHRIFSSCWRGLEPPRHLMIFTGRALRAGAGKAGFSRVEVWTTAVNAGGMYWRSHCIRAGVKGKETRLLSLCGLVLAAGFFVGGLLLSRLRPWEGEELVLRAYK